MGRIRLTGATSGYTELRAANAAGNNTIILPTTNGGEVIVSDSSGNVNIDSGTFYVDASNNRVGVGTSSPSELLHIAGVTNPAIVLQDTTNNTDARIKTNNNGDLVFEADYNGEAADTRISFEIDGSEKARFDSSGRLGVGSTSDPGGIGSRLWIDTTGDTYFTANTTGSGNLTGLHFRNSNGNGEARILNNTGGALTFYRSPGNEAVRIDSSGRVGIGTSSPQVKSHIVDTNGDVLRLQRDGAFTGSWGVKIGQAITGDFTLRDEENNLNVISIPKGTGRVGIGTTSPGCIFHAETTGAEIARLNSTAGIGGYLSVQTSGSYVGYFGAATALAGSGTSSDLAIRAQNNLLFTIGSTERARIDSSGRLLIGTSSARANMFNSTLSSAFQVEGTTHDTSSVSIVRNSNDSSTAAFVLGKSRSTAAGGSTLVANNDTIAYLTFQGADGSQLVECASIGAYIDGTPGADDMPGRLVFSTTADGASSPTERMRIGNGGLTSIGGVYTFTTGNAANVNVDSSGYLQRSTSSIKYKTDVETLDDQYADALLACRPVWYRSTCEHDCAEHSYWGFIAEEVASIDPRLVHWKTTEITHDENGAAVSTPCTPEPEGVQYERFVPHLLNLIKRQKEQIEAMEARLTALESA